MRASSCWVCSQIPVSSAPSGSARRWKSRSAARRLTRSTGLELRGPGVGRREHLVQRVHAGGHAVGVGALEQQEARDRVGVRRRGHRAQVGVKAADRLQQDQRRARRRRGRVLAAGGSRHAQHPQHHVGDLDQAARVEEALGLVAQHRAVGDAPDQRRALLDVLRGEVRARRAPPSRAGRRRAGRAWSC